MASAEGCVDVSTDYFGSGLRVIANTGRELAFGLVSGVPGDGVGAVVIISPTMCGPLGVGVGSHGSDPLSKEQRKTIDDTLMLLPLP